MCNNSRFCKRHTNNTLNDKRAKQHELMKNWSIKTRERVVRVRKSSSSKFPNLCAHIRQLPMWCVQYHIEGHATAAAAHSLQPFKTHPTFNHRHKGNLFTRFFFFTTSLVNLTLESCNLIYHWMWSLHWCRLLDMTQLAAWLSTLKREKKIWKIMEAEDRRQIKMMKIVAPLLTLLSGAQYNKDRLIIKWWRRHSKEYNMRSQSQVKSIVQCRESSLHWFGGKKERKVEEAMLLLVYCWQMSRLRQKRAGSRTAIECVVELARASAEFPSEYEIWVMHVQHFLCAARCAWKD